LGNRGKAEKLIYAIGVTDTVIWGVWTKTVKYRKLKKEDFYTK